MAVFAWIAPRSVAISVAGTDTTFTPPGTYGPPETPNANHQKKIA